MCAGRATGKSAGGLYIELEICKHCNTNSEADQIFLRGHILWIWSLCFYCLCSMYDNISRKKSYPRNVILAVITIDALFLLRNLSSRIPFSVILTAWTGVPSLLYVSSIIPSSRSWHNMAETILLSYLHCEKKSSDRINISLSTPLSHFLSIM